MAIATIPRINCANPAPTCESINTQLIDQLNAIIPSMNLADTNTATHATQAQNAKTQAETARDQAQSSATSASNTKTEIEALVGQITVTNGALQPVKSIILASNTDTVSITNKAIMFVAVGGVTMGVNTANRTNTTYKLNKVYPSGTEVLIQALN